MDIQNKKCVMIIEHELPLGMIANTAGIMGVTLGKYISEYIGLDVFDKNGNMHLGIVAFPIPILKANKEKMKEIRQKLYQEEFSSCIVVDFSDVAQSCNYYSQFIEKIGNTEEEELIYFGIGICGEKKLVNKLTGNLPLLR